MKNITMELHFLKVENTKESLLSLSVLINKLNIKFGNVATYEFAIIDKKGSTGCLDDFWVTTTAIEKSFYHPNDELLSGSSGQFGSYVYLKINKDTIFPYGLPTLYICNEKYYLKHKALTEL